MRFFIFILLIILSHSSLKAQEIPLQNSIANGEKIYARKCMVCHSKDGLGKGKRIPPLANSDYLFNNQTASIRGILFGQKEEISVNGILYNRKMKAIKLDDQEIADVMNYIQNSWGNSNTKIVGKKMVKEIRLEN